MKYILIVLISILTLHPIFSQENIDTDITSTYYFIRHAEKDKSNKTNRDPFLLEAGKARANRWGDIFKHVRFDAIYSTDYNRTKATAQPTATKNNLSITIYNPRDLNIPSFLKETQGKTVLVVGHSNSTPAFVNKIIDEEKYEMIDESNNSNLYIVTIIHNKISDKLLVIN